jgi:hypothetical protein
MANLRLPLALCLALCVAAASSACQGEARSPRNPTATPTAGPIATQSAGNRTSTITTPPGSVIPPVTSQTPKAATPPSDTATGAKKCTVQGVAGGHLNFRAGASTTAEDIGDLADGTEVDFVANDAGGWVKIRYNGQDGFACDTCNGDDNLNCEGASMSLDGAPPVRSRNPNPDGSFG